VGNVADVLEDIQAQIGADDDPARLLLSDPDGDSIADADVLLGDEAVVDKDGAAVVRPEGATSDDARVEGSGIGRYASEKERGLLALCSNNE
jgi:hypothetical protein